MPGVLERLRLTHGGISVEGTPRRLAVTVADLAARQPDAEDRLRGPPAKVSTPTAACNRFHHLAPIFAAAVHDMAARGFDKSHVAVPSTVRSVCLRPQGQQGHAASVRGAGGVRKRWRPQQGAGGLLQKERRIRCGRDSGGGRQRHRVRLGHCQAERPSSCRGARLSISFWAWNHQPTLRSSAVIEMRKHRMPEILYMKALHFVADGMVNESCSKFICHGVALAGACGAASGVASRGALQGLHAMAWRCRLFATVAVAARVARRCGGAGPVRWPHSGPHHQGAPQCQPAAGPGAEAEVPEASALIPFTLLFGSTHCQ